MERNFKTMLEALWAKDRFVCVGLDSELAKIPASAARHCPKNTVLNFNRCLIDATYDLVCAYKPQIAFYEEQGPEGLAALMETVKYIHEKAPEVPVICDAKRGDVDNTNLAYVKTIFNTYGFDAVTVNPYLGGAALQPFFDRLDKGIIVLCRTSNKGAGEFQDLHTLTLDPRKKPEGMSTEEWLKALCADSMVLYQRVAKTVAEKWNKNNNAFLVMGATYPCEGKLVRELTGDMGFLVPGVGAQGGDIEATVLNCMDGKTWGMIVNSSRGIIFASNGPDFAAAARQKTLELSQLINKFRQAEPLPSKL